MSYDVLRRPEAAKPSSSGQTAKPPTILLGNSLENAHPPAPPELKDNDFRIVLMHKNGHDKIALSDSEMSRGVLLFGAPGTGKSTVMEKIARQTLNQLGAADTCIIFDAKGDYARAFFDARNPRHLLIGNSPMYRSFSQRWNIFCEVGDLGELMYAGANDSAAHEQALGEIARLLFANQSQNTSQPFFPLAAADVTSKIMIDLLRRARAMGRSDLLCTREVVGAIRSAGPAFFRAMLARNPDFVSVRNYLGLGLSDADDMGMNDQGLGVYGTMSAMIASVFVGVFGSGQPADQFSLRNAVRAGGYTVFVEYDMALGETLGPLYKLLFQSAIMEALGRSNDRRGNIYFFMDELALLPPCRMQDLLNFGRDLGNGKGVRLVAGLQNINQLQPAYTHEQAYALLAGFGTLISFASRDAESREWVSHRMGKSYQNIEFKPSEHVAPLYIQREGYTVEDWALRGMVAGTAVIEVCGNPPFSFEFAQ